ncbi:MAG TPA: hypothetical protein VGA55_06480 [Bacteroidota bacterium]
MNASIIDNKTLAVVLGLLFIGGAAFIAGLRRTPNTIEHTTGCVIQEPDGQTFVCGAYA